jgi:LysM repeat protein
MKKSAYVGLGALLALMLGVAFLFSSLLSNSTEPLDVNSARTHGDDIAARGGSRVADIPNFDPASRRAPAPTPEMLQINVPQYGGDVGTFPNTGGVSRPDPVPANAQSKQHTIQQGDNYYVLAEKYYGSHAGRFVQLIAKANPDKDPARLKIGDVLVIPPKPADAQTAPAPAPQTRQGQTTGAVNVSETRQTRTSTATVTTTTVETSLAAYKTYVVKEGDGFRKIAKKLLGDENRWKELFELNRDLGLVKDENGLRAGQKIAVTKINN